MKHISIKTMMTGTAVVAAFFGGWAAHEFSTRHSEGPVIIGMPPDPAIAQLKNAWAEPEYSPHSLQEDLVELIEEKQFASAIRLLDAVRLDIQLAADGGQGYYAIGGNQIQNPGTNVDYNRERDFMLPGTGCCVESMLWVDRAWQFAKNYNAYRDNVELLP